MMQEKIKRGWSDAKRKTRILDFCIFLQKKSLSRKNS